MKLQTASTIVQLLLVIAFPGFIRGYDCQRCAAHSTTTDHRCEVAHASAAADDSCCPSSEKTEAVEQLEAEPQLRSQASEELQLTGICCHRWHDCGENHHEHCWCSAFWMPCYSNGTRTTCQDLLLPSATGRPVESPAIASAANASTQDADGTPLSGRDIRARIASLLI